jgi:acyl-CoA synthetase (AMP-forming)/AMP-acid ligase II
VDISDHDAGAPAVIMSTGDTVPFGRLVERSNRVAHVLHGAGLRRGDGVVLMLPNSPEFFEVAWAAQHSGLYYTPVNTHLTLDEVEYIIDDSGASAVFLHASMADLAAALAGRNPEVTLRVAVGGPVAGYALYDEALADSPATPPPEPSQGTEMLYSSGTTGRPKAVRRPLPGDAGSWAQATLEVALRDRYGLAPGGRYLSPAPLYHSAPLNYTMAVLRLGATAVVMERFDAEGALALIERHRVTHAQFVPTMFVRMLKLPEEVRRRYDVSSLRCVLHAAAPCPVEVKRQMMDWWGPIIHEYYGGTEGFAGTMIGPEEWLAHPGSVGRPMSPVHVIGEDGTELGPGEAGELYFEGGPDFEYHNDPAKTASIRDEHGWRTLGDVGYLDQDGYLYLTDRATFMIVSGGVNIYPQEAENVLVMHPEVADVAVFGVPNPDFGEEVKAVVQPADWDRAGDRLAKELLAYCREHLAAYKCPRSVDFERELPRDPNGKLYKRRLRERYWEGHGTRLL